MFHELFPDDFNQVLQFYGKTETVFPLILAVLERKQAGRVFVNDVVNPVAALVVNKFGFVQFAGAAINNEIEAGVVSFFENPLPGIPNYLLWYSPPRGFQKMLDAHSVRRRERKRFVLKRQSYEHPAQCPPGYELHLLDGNLLAASAKFNLNIGSRFWASDDDFLQNGLGTCITKEGEVVCLCYSACVAGDMAEVDVITQENFRDQGLAVVVAQSFISECLKKGITPTWDCFVSNAASEKLARKLGFIVSCKYLFYSFNIPTDFR